MGSIGGKSNGGKADGGKSIQFETQSMRAQSASKIGGKPTAGK
jgi:hypothetical protein